MVYVCAMYTYLHTYDGNGDTSGPQDGKERAGTGKRSTHFESAPVPRKSYARFEYLLHCL